MLYLIQLVISGVMVGAIYGLMSLGVVVIYKSSNIFNLAVGECVALGAFVGWAIFIQLGWPLPLMIIGLLIVSLLLAVIIERFLMRPMIGQPLLSAVLITIALSEVLAGIMTLLWPGGGKMFPPFLAGTFKLGEQISISQELIANFIICILAFLLFMLFFQRSKAGLVMRAASEDQQLAQSGGIKVTRMVMLAWFIAMLTASIGGVLLGSLHGVEQGGIAALGFKVFPAVMVGGLESIPGAIVGGILVGVSESLGAGYLDAIVGGGMTEIIPFVILLVVLMFMPYGLWGHKRIERV